ncbi:MAG: hypothetical protein EAZ70_10710 [Runella slithyformis]|nr:MAG: hypothetical protein EAY79_11165 [Runella slithyformis]TAF25174.1 MAG: hypothetical protein EAZ70_10710 [Runella slithyformis]TAF49902.1 MAG: hypothetical protein EAZ63_00020 [Runella slithyformis]
MKNVLLMHLSRVYLLLLWLFLGVIGQLSAQTVPNSVQNVTPPQTYLQQSDNLLRFLDKSPINTGILYDRSFTLADIEDFNGQIDASASHSEHFYQAVRLAAGSLISTITGARCK